MAEFKPKLRSRFRANYEPFRGACPKFGHTGPLHRQNSTGFGPTPPTSTRHRPNLSDFDGALWAESPCIPSMVAEVRAATPSLSRRGCCAARPREPSAGYETDPAELRVRARRAAGECVGATRPRNDHGPALRGDHRRAVSPNRSATASRRTAPCARAAPRCLDASRWPGPPPRRLRRGGPTLSGTFGGGGGGGNLGPQSGDGSLGSALRRPSVDLLVVSGDCERPALVGCVPALG